MTPYKNDTFQQFLIDSALRRRSANAALERVAISVATMDTRFPALFGKKTKRAK